MQREPYGCTLHVFKSTFQFWLMITSNPRAGYSFLQPLLFFLACCPCFYENCTVWGCTASPGTWEPREMTGMISPPSASVRACCYFIPSCHDWLKGSPDSLLFAVGVPQDSEGSMEVAALFTLSVSQACCEWLVFAGLWDCWGSWDFQDLRGFCINSLCESMSRQHCLITSCCLNTSGNMWV